LEMMVVPEKGRGREVMLDVLIQEELSVPPVKLENEVQRLRTALAALTQFVVDKLLVTDQECISGANGLVRESELGILLSRMGVQPGQVTVMGRSEIPES